MAAVPANRSGGVTVDRGFWRWVRWEFDRDIEITTAIRLITYERFIKGGLLVAAGIALLVTGERTNVHDLVARYQTELNFQPADTWWSGVAKALLTRMARLKASTATLIAAGAMTYGAVEIFEGVGLILRKRWAEYLVVVATGGFIPLELGELAKHPTVVKLGGTAINVAIVVYLVWSKRLFIERPGDEPFDGPVPGAGRRSRTLR